MLESGDREYVKAQLLSRVGSDISPRQTFISELPIDIAIQLEEGLAPQVLVERVLVFCEADGWRRSPPALSSLLTALLGNSGRIPELVAKLTVPPGAQATLDPFTTSILDIGLPFLDRSETRKVLRTWLDLMPRQQVMVVEGPSQTGKTYTNDFVRHIVRHVMTTSSDIRTVIVAFDRDQARSVGPLELAKDLVWYISGVVAGAPEYDTNTTAFVKQLVTWVLGEANKAGLKWWFVLDGFRSSHPGEEPGWELRDDTREFLVAFVRGLTNGINAARHRLLLLDFDRAILPLPPGAVGFDRTCPIPHAAVRTVIDSIIAKSASSLDPDAVEADILDGLSSPIAELPELNARLVDLLAEAA
ncbi:hypothetical protein [Sphingomonas lacusdianchii]|uniref:hypothetical protein n=1 Tax=Sphingomonas lacusdianchii TaxID=2917992 RepID=UPI001F585639|nr:hypothetical protein [Sphingomonas sp. JXJ CY 53]